MTDILSKIGGIDTVEEAIRLFEARMDKENLLKAGSLKQEAVILKIANAIAICRPDSVFLNTGSDADRDFIRAEALKKGEEAPLAMENHTIHYDLKEEQGRIVDRTFYIADEDEKISTLAKRISRDEATDDIIGKMTGIMSGKIMMVGFYIRGPAGAPVSNPAMEISSSAYVSHSAEILYRNIFENFEKEAARQGHFYTNLHSEGLNRPEDLPGARVYMDRRWRTTYSVNCTYAGNTLLLKKGNHRFSVDKAVYENRGETLAEHMFITGLDGPGGRVTWCTGAAPSGCGKTTTAMAGDHFLGDDLAQMWIDEKGRVRAVNPEAGIFGIVEDVNREGDPVLMDVLRKPGAEVIWSNVLIDDEKTPHWVGGGEEHPEAGFNFQGPWKKGMKDENGKEVPLSHPNARVTVSAKSLSNCSEMLDAPEGVEIRIITYSGRDSDTMPPVWVAKTPEQGVATGASIVSAATATEVGATGVKRAPWANAPFIPGALGDYLDAQFKFFRNKKMDKARAPIIAGLNYFLTCGARGGGGTGLLGEKRDVKVWLAWLERRVHGELDAIDTPIGLLPGYVDLKRLFQELIGKDYSEDLYIKHFSLYAEKIIARLELQLEAYKKEDDISEKLFTVLTEQREGLLDLKGKHGPVIAPAALS